jgi:hypothetical protein
MFIPFIIWSFSPFVTARKRFYTAVLYARLLMVLVACQILRIISFTVTQLPAPNYHCRLGRDTAVREMPEHWWGHVVVDVGRQVRAASHGWGSPTPWHTRWQAAAELPADSGGSCYYSHTFKQPGKRPPTLTCAGHPRLRRPHLLIAHHVCADWGAHLHRVWRDTSHQGGCTSVCRAAVHPTVPGISCYACQGKPAWLL